MKFPALHARLRGWLLNVGSSYADAAVGGIVFIVLTPVIVREVGAEAYALWVLAHTVSFYLAFLDLGFANAQVRYHARFAAQGKDALVHQVIATSFVSLVVAGAIATLGGVGLALLHPEEWLDISPPRGGQFRTVLILLSVNLFVAFVSTALANIYEGAQRFDLRNLRSIVIRALTAGAQWAALKQGGDVVELVAIELGAGCLTVVVDFALTSRILPGWWRIGVRFHRHVWRRLRSFSLWTSADEVLTEGGAHLDHFLIAAVFPLVLLTPYSLCTGVAGVMLAAVHPVVETFFPLASGLHAQQRASDLSRLMIAGTKVATAIAAPIAIVLAFFGKPLIQLWVPEAGGDIPNGLMPAVVLDYLTSMYLWTATVILVAIGRTRLVVALTVTEIILGVVLMLVLAPRYGLVGIALASFIANVLIGFSLQVPLAARAARVTLGELVGSAIGRVALATVPALVAAAVLANSFQLTSWPVLAGSVLCIAAIYGAGLWLLGTDREERKLYLTLWKNASES